MSPSFAEEAAFTKPLLINRPDLPELPGRLRRSKSRGIVMANVFVDDRGGVQKIEMLRSTGKARLDAYISSWIRSWSFIPKIVDDDSVASYTIITVRYDLSRKLFEAPLPLEAPAEIPEKVVLKMSGVEQDPVASANPVPVETLKFPEIPISIQKLGVKGDARFFLTIDSSGKVVSLEADPKHTILTEMAKWMTNYLKTTRWKTEKATGITFPAMIEITIHYNCVLCRFMFDEPRWKTKK